MGKSGNVEREGNRVGKSVWIEAREALKRRHYRKAANQLRPLAEKGCAEAQFQMGYLYFTSAQVDFDESMQWLRLAVEQEHAEALYYLSCTGKDRSFGQPDTRAGLKMLERAACKHSAKAQRTLGCMYATGDGVRKDLKRARKWYRLAAENGEVESQYDLGLMLWLGEGGARNAKKAILYFNKAAQGGHSTAQEIAQNISANKGRWAVSKH